MSGSSTMVFTRTCDATRLLALMLRNLGQRAIPISGHMSQVYHCNWLMIEFGFFNLSFALFYTQILLCLQNVCYSQRDLGPWINLRQESAIFLFALMWQAEGLIFHLLIWSSIMIFQQTLRSAFLSVQLMWQNIFVYLLIFKSVAGLHPSSGKNSSCRTIWCCNFARESVWVGMVFADREAYW